jgi:hypothetical protein
MTRERNLIWYPNDYIFAVIDNHEDAERAVSDLRKAGFHADNVRLLHGGESMEYIDAGCQHCNFFQQLLRAVWRVATVEGMTLSELEDEGRSGRDVIAVHLENREQVETARDILSIHNARHIEHFQHGTTSEGMDS